MLVKIFNMIDFNSNDKKAKAFNNFILILIVINLIVIIIESYKNIYLAYKIYFDLFEIITISVFTVEYILRVATSIYITDEGSRIFRIISYLLSPMALIDLLAIAPFYLPFLISVDLRFIRILRIFRVFRIMKLNKYSSSLELLFRVLKKEKQNLLITLMMAGILIFMSATIMYYIEGEIQPEHFSSIPATFWWAVNTLTTVGYGDVYPVTAGGRIISSVISILGIGVVAIPTGIISSGFVNELRDRSEN